MLRGCRKWLFRELSAKKSQKCHWGCLSYPCSSCVMGKLEKPALQARLSYQKYLSASQGRLIPSKPSLKSWQDGVSPVKTLPGKHQHCPAPNPAEAENSQLHIPFPPFFFLHKTPRLDTAHLQVSPGGKSPFLSLGFDTSSAQSTEKP